MNKSIAAVIVVMTSMILLMGYHQSVISKNTHRIDDIEELYRRTEDRWRGTGQRQFVEQEIQAWRREFMRLNPDLKFPEKKRP